ncbi:MAG: tetratricopeptide repeat protein [Gemmatimonadales bacterium]
MALSEIEKLERRYAENPQGLTFAPLAEVHRKNGDVTRALELLRPGLTLHPDYIPASIVLGRCHLDLGELPDAETAFTHVLSLDSENVIALKALADIAERQFRFDDAERWLRTLLAIDRSNDEAREQLGRVESSHRQAATASSATPDAAFITGLGEPPSVEAAPEGPAAADTTEPPTGTSAERDDTPAHGLPPLPEPPQEAVLAWVEAPGRDASDEARPLQLEDLDLSDANAAPPPAGIQLEQPVTLDEPVQPLSGLVGRDDQADLHEPDGAFRVETAEDIVLESTGYSEFQVANASEELLTRDRPAHQDPLMPEKAAIEKEHTERPAAPPADSTSVADPSLAEAGAADRWPADLVASSQGATGDPAAGVSASDSVGTAAAPVAADTGSAVADAPGRVTDVPRTVDALAEAAPPQVAGWSAPTSAEGPATPSDASRPEPAAASTSWSAPQAEPPTHREPDLMVTESMAELLLQQGHRAEALVVYRHLERQTGNRRFSDRLAELERHAADDRTSAASAEPALVRGEAAPAATAAPSPSYSVQETGGQSVRDFLQGVLSGRLPAAPASPPRAVEAPSSATGGAPEGAPTRPAHDSLSLSSVFGEETAPTPPAVPAGNAASPQGGVSYDEFFGGSGSAGSSRSRGADTKSDDLDQFHAWLQNLKR